jgi:hypothetical protein
MNKNIIIRMMINNLIICSIVITSLIWGFRRVIIVTIKTNFSKKLEKVIINIPQRNKIFLIKEINFLSNHRL